jgi:hypothetical protein
MPVHVISKKDIPAKQERHRESALEHTKEWQIAMTKLQHGLVENEALKIVLSPETTKAMKHAGPMFRKMLLKRMKAANIRYKVFLQGSEGGQPIIFICK